MVMVMVIYLYFVTRNRARALHRELENCGSGSSDEVLPEDGVNVGAIGAPPARIPLPRHPTMVGVVELDQEAVYRVPLLLYINENTSATVGETINRVDVMNKHDLGIDLQLQDCLEWCVLDASGIVRVELLHRSAGILRSNGEQFSLYLVKFGIVPSIDLGICAVNVDGVVEAGVSAGTDSGVQKGNVVICLVSRPHPVQQITVDLVLTLAMVLFQVDYGEKLPQISE